MVMNKNEIMIIAVPSAIAALLVLLVIVSTIICYVCCCKRRKKSQSVGESSVDALDVHRSVSGDSDRGIEGQVTVENGSKSSTKTGKSGRDYQPAKGEGFGLPKSSSSNSKKKSKKNLLNEKKKEELLERVSKAKIEAEVIEYIMKTGQHVVDSLQTLRDRLLNVKTTDKTPEGDVPTQFDLASFEEDMGRYKGHSDRREGAYGAYAETVLNLSEKISPKNSLLEKREPNCKILQAEVKVLERRIKGYTQAGKTEDPQLRAEVKSLAKILWVLDHIRSRTEAVEQQAGALLTTIESLAVDERIAKDRKVKIYFHALAAKWCYDETLKGEDPCIKYHILQGFLSCEGLLDEQKKAKNERPAHVGAGLKTGSQDGLADTLPSGNSHPAKSTGEKVEDSDDLPSTESETSGLRPRVRSFSERAAGAAENAGAKMSTLRDRGTRALGNLMSKLKESVDGTSEGLHTIREAEEPETEGNKARHAEVNLSELKQEAAKKQQEEEKKQQEEEKRHREEKRQQEAKRQQVDREYAETVRQNREIAEADDSVKILAPTGVRKTGDAEYLTKDAGNPFIQRLAKEKEKQEKERKEKEKKEKGDGMSSGGTLVEKERVLTKAEVPNNLPDPSATVGAIEPVKSELAAAVQGRPGSVPVGGAKGEDVKSKLAKSPGASVEEAIPVAKSADYPNLIVFSTDSVTEEDTLGLTGRSTENVSEGLGKSVLLQDADAAVEVSLQNLQHEVVDVERPTSVSPTTSIKEDVLEPIAPAESSKPTETEDVKTKEASSLEEEGERFIRLKTLAGPQAVATTVDVIAPTPPLPTPSEQKPEEERGSDNTDKEETVKSPEVSEPVSTEVVAVLDTAAVPEDNSTEEAEAVIEVPTPVIKKENFATYKTEFLRFFKGIGYPEYPTLELKAFGTDGDESIKGLEEEVYQLIDLMSKYELGERMTDEEMGRIDEEAINAKMLELYKIMEARENLYYQIVLDDNREKEEHELAASVSKVATARANVKSYVAQNYFADLGFDKYRENLKVRLTEYDQALCNAKKRMKYLELKCKRSAGAECEKVYKKLCRRYITDFEMDQQLATKVEHEYCDYQQYIESTKNDLLRVHEFLQSTAAITKYGVLVERVFGQSGFFENMLGQVEKAHQEYMVSGAARDTMLSETRILSRGTTGAEVGQEKGRSKANTGASASGGGRVTTPKKAKAEKTPSPSAIGKLKSGGMKMFQKLKKGLTDVNTQNREIETSTQNRKREMGVTTTAVSGIPVNHDPSTTDGRRSSNTSSTGSQASAGSSERDPSLTSERRGSNTSNTPSLASAGSGNCDQLEPLVQGKDTDSVVSESLEVNNTDKSPK